MKTTTTETTTIYLTEEEKDAFFMVDTILLSLQERNKGAKLFESVLTGEVVRVEELARVRGVLSFVCPEENIPQTFEKN